MSCTPGIRNLFTKSSARCADHATVGQGGGRHRWPPRIDSDRRYRSLFLVVLLLNSAIFWYLLADHRTPLGHDAWTYYATQHWFLSSAGADGELPAWIPYAAHGMPANTAFIAQGGLLQLVLLLAPSLFQGLDFLPLFLLGLYVDELLLLVGVWLLARRFFDSPWTVFFVACAASGTCLWVEQVWYGLHSIAAVPLVIVLAHGLLETGARWKGALALNLLMMQALGHIPGAVLIPSLAVVCYFAAARPRRSRLVPRLGDLAWLVVGLLPLVLSQAAALVGGGGLVWSQPPSPSLGEPSALLSLVLGIPVSRDASLFCGSLTLAFAAAAFVCAPRPALRALAFLAGGIAALAALAWTLRRGVPALAARSVLVQAAPFAKLVVVFLGGRGFHEVLRRGLSGPALAAGGLVSFATALADGALSGVLTVGRDPAAVEWLGRLSAAPPPWVHFRNEVAEVLGAASFFALVASLLLLLWGAGRRCAALALALTMLVHPLDVFSWKFRLTWWTTRAAAPDQRPLHALAPAPYLARRQADLGECPRALAMVGALSDTGTGLGAVPDPWFHWDGAVPSPEAQQRSASVDELVRALAPRPVNPRVVGLSADKIRHFPSAIERPAFAILEAMRAPDFDGVPLFIEGVKAGEPRPASNASIGVTAFAANRITAQLRDSGGGWLYYADAWDAGWTARVNGVEVPVRRANIAYKAVEVPAGHSVVEFRYAPGARRWIARCLGIDALVLIMATISLATRQLGTGP